MFNTAGEGEAPSKRLDGVRVGRRRPEAGPFSSLIFEGGFGIPAGGDV